MPLGGESQPTPLELIAEGDPDALGGYYDAHAGTVNEYCAQLCPPPRVDEAVQAAFTDFFGRVRSASSDPDVDELLRQSARVAAAGRMDLTGVREPVCRFVPELIAARTNGEGPRDGAAFDEHLTACRFCQVTAQRLEDAERTLLSTPTSPGPAAVRTAWLEIASRAEPATVAPVEEPRAVENAPAPEAGSSPAAEPSAQPAAARRRRGGLIGAARRVAPSRWR